MGGGDEDEGAGLGRARFLLRYDGVLEAGEGAVALWYVLRGKVAVGEVLRDGLEFLGGRGEGWPEVDVDAEVGGLEDQAL